MGQRCSSGQELGRISTPPQSNRQPSVGSERVRRSPMFCVQYLGDFSTDSNLRPTNMHSEILSQISIRGIWYSAATVDPTQRLPLTVSLLRSPLCRRGVGQKFGSPKKNPEMCFRMKFSRESPKFRRRSIGDFVTSRPRFAATDHPTILQLSRRWNILQGR